MTQKSRDHSRSRKSFRIVAGISSLLIGATALAACSATPPEDAEGLAGVTLIIGQQGPSLETTLTASGVLDGTEYNVQFATFANSPTLQAGLTSGAADVGLYGDYSQIQAQGNAVPEWTDATVPYKNIFLAKPAVPEYFPYVTAAASRSGITSLEQAKGKRWVYSPGATNYQTYIQTLNHLNWTPEDVEPVVLDNAAGSAALESNQVDVWSGSPGSISVALSQGAKIISHADEVGLAGYIAVPARTESLEDPDKAAAIEDFVKRLTKYYDWYNTHPSEAQAALVDGLKLTPKQAEISWLYTRFRPAPIDDESLDVVQGLSEVALKFGSIQHAVEIRQGWDGRFNDVVTATLDEIGFDQNLDQSLKPNP